MSKKPKIDINKLKLPQNGETIKETLSNVARINISNNSWEEEFDETYGRIFEKTIKAPPEYPKLNELIIKTQLLSNNFIKSFISKTRQEAIREALGEVELEEKKLIPMKEFDDLTNTINSNRGGYNEAVLKLKAKISTIKKQLLK